MRWWSGLRYYLRRFRGAIIMITHDRYFLDSVCNRIVEVDKGQTYSYDTNYSGFLEIKAAREESERASERKRQVHPKKRNRVDAARRKESFHKAEGTHPKISGSARPKRTADRRKS